jgi:quercetin dioxygenase-like cupin family protein
MKRVAFHVHITRISPPRSPTLRTIGKTASGQIEEEWIMLHNQTNGQTLQRDLARSCWTEASDPMHRAARSSRRWRPTVAKLGCALLLGIMAGGSGTAAEQEAAVTNLFQGPLGVADGVEVVSYRVAAPGGAPAVPRHRHHGDEFLYVLDGAVTVTMEGAAPATVRQGEMFHVPYGIAHTAQNASETEAGRVLVFHVKEAGQPVRVPADVPLPLDYLERHPI